MDFELGPIRPPSEAYSILLRLTRNCPWNRCAFCHTYKGTKFSLRTVEEVRNDIDAIYHTAACILRAAQKNSESTALTEEMLREVSDEEGIPHHLVRQVAFWISSGMESLFLQDADSLVMKTPGIVEILTYIRGKFPSIKRITTYARAKTVSRKKPEELKQIREAGLDRIHIGLESGSDTVLDLICKGVTGEEHVLAGTKAMDAGFELSEYFMPGIGGTDLSDENADRSADVLNRINPTFIRLRSAVPIPGTPLHDLMLQEKWTPLSEEDKVKEIHRFISRLDGITSTVTSDHMMNLLEDLEGSLPEGRDRMLSRADDFLSMDEEDRESFIIGRRLGHFRYLSDYKRNPEITALRVRLKKSYGSIDAAVLEILSQFI